MYFDFENNLTFWQDKSDKFPLKFADQGGEIIGGKSIAS